MAKFRETLWLLRSDQNVDSVTLLSKFQCKLPVKCHINTREREGFEPRTIGISVRHTTTRPQRQPPSRKPIEVIPSQQNSSSCEICGGDREREGKQFPFSELASNSFQHNRVKNAKWPLLSQKIFSLLHICWLFYGKLNSRELQKSVKMV